MNLITVFFFILCFLLFSCQEKEEEVLKERPIYAGPMMTAYNINTLYSENGKVKVSIEAPLQTEFQDGNREFKKGITVTHYDSTGKAISRLTSDYAKYVKVHDIYTAIGNVIVENLEKKETLKSEELHWDKTNHRVFTDKYVHIKTEKEILTGVGLEAKDDFSEYQILEPEGIFSVEQSEMGL